VSSLKKDYSEPLLPGGDDEGLGLEKATFKWNEVTEPAEADKGKTTGSPSASRTPSVNGEESGTVVEDSASVAESGDRVFELRDISVIFPSGQLTVVTGPTASGKTALLASICPICIS